MILVLVLIFFLTVHKHKLLLRESVSPRSPCHPLPSITTPLLTPPPSPRQPLPSITSPLAPPPNQCHGPSLRPNPETRHRNMSPQIAPTQPATSEPNRWPDPLITSWTQQEPLGTSWNQAGTMVEPAGTKIYVNLYVYTSQVSK